MTFLPEPESLVVWPAVDAAVARRDADRFTFSWRVPAGRVVVRHRGRLLAEANGTRQVEVSGLTDLTALQPQFRLSFVGGPLSGADLTVAERFLPLAGGVNFRDLGGYRTRDGRAVRWGQVYRSGMLSQLEEADLMALAGLDLRLVCDFRSRSEAERYPDRLPDGTTGAYRAMPMMMEGNRWWQIARLFWHRNNLDRLLQSGYTQVVIGQNAAVVGATLHALADPANRPAVLHCTAGKDRTGVIAALLLALLGVDDETIVADYSLSNLAYRRYAGTLAHDIERLSRLGFSAEQVRPLLVANPAVLRAALAEIRAVHGSIEAYLRGPAGLDTAVLEQLRAELLE